MPTHLLTNRYISTYASLTHFSDDSAPKLLSVFAFIRNCIVQRRTTRENESMVTSKYTCVPYRSGVSKSVIFSCYFYRMG